MSRELSRLSTREENLSEILLETLIPAQSRNTLRALNDAQPRIEPPRRLL